MGVCESTFDERIDRLSSVFSMLTQTTSLNEKRAILDCIPNSLQDDLQACLDVLANRVTFGYKMARYEHIVMRILLVICGMSEITGHSFNR